MLVMVIHQMFIRDMLIKIIDNVYYNVIIHHNYIMNQQFMVRCVYNILIVYKLIFIVIHYKMMKNNVFNYVIVLIYIFKIQLIDIVQNIINQNQLVKI